jgi:hypothetical protein
MLLDELRTPLSTNSPITDPKSPTTDPKSPITDPKSPMLLPLLINYPLLLKVPCSIPFLLSFTALASLIFDKT